VAKRRRQAKIPTLAWERPRGAIGSRVLGRGFQFYGAVVIGLFMAVGLGVVAYAFLADELEERRRPGSTAVQVEDTRFRLDYFSDRLTMFVAEQGGLGAVQPLSALPAVSDLITREEIVRRFAGEFDLTASEEEIQEGIASRLGITVDDETFDVVFEQELARSRLSEEDYRLMVQATVLTDELQQHFEGEVPESAESVLYRQILVSEQATADDIKQQIEDGADFAALAAEDSNLDVANKENGGEVGWLPRGVLDASTEELVFPLEPGEVSTIPTANGVFVVEMLEKEEDRAIEEEAIPPLAAGLLADWVQEKGETLAIVSSVVPGAESYDPKKADWAVSRAYTQPEIPVPVQGDLGG
jgi:parvulin-like peptidyl-prolyl isomerase